MQKPSGQPRAWGWVACGVLIAWQLPYVLLRTAAPDGWATELVRVPGYGHDITLSESRHPRIPMRQWMSAEIIEGINTIFCKLPGKVDLMITGRAVTF